MMKMSNTGDGTVSVLFGMPIRAVKSATFPHYLAGIFRCA